MREDLKHGKGYCQPMADYLFETRLQISLVVAFIKIKHLVQNDAGALEKFAHMRFFQNMQRT